MEENTPAGFLHSLIGHHIQIRSKWGPLYAGILVSCDSFMNIQLREGVEIGKSKTELGEMLIRNNNILHISEVDA